MMSGIDKVLGDFIVESQENLERLDHEFVALEHDPQNSELLASIFRTIHTIKGSAGFLSLTNLEQISHYAEDVLAKLRDHSLTLNTDMITTLLHAIDSIKTILVNLEKTSEEGELDVLDIVMELRKVAESAQKPSTITTPQELNEYALEKLPEHDNSSIAKELKLSETLEASNVAIEDTRIHVDVHLLDQLMNMTGELVLSRNQIVQFANTIEQRNFRMIVQRMNVVVSELQELVMKTRMQPVKKVLGIFPRLVRDMSKLQGKDVMLVMEGQNTELDRTLIESIKDPLTHLVRNALDHGIEPPEVRAQLGKPATAVITVKAYHEGGQVVIEITDDGAGISLEKVKAKALRERLLTPQQAEEMSERDLINLIFRPGFSTAEIVTSISGRGVGMDVVKKNLDKIGGVIDIQTKKDQGTTIKIRIPITLAIIPVLIIKSGNHPFAIPQVNLEELLMIQTDNPDEKGIELVHGAEVYRLRGELLPLLRLNTILRLPSVKQETSENIHIVVLSSGDIRYGLIIDEVGDTEEIVVKPLSKHIKQLQCYDGATIMGDGKVALILNISGLLKITQLTMETLKKIQQTVGEEEKTRQVITSKAQQQTIVLFKIGQHEYYGVPLAFVVRLEKFSSAQIELSGGREVMQYRQTILPLLRLEDYLNIPRAPDTGMLSLIVFAIEKQIGLVVSEILDTVEISTHIDTETFQQKGILGSAIVQGHSVLILDVHGLIEMAYPTWYKKFFTSQLTEQERENTRILLVEDSSFFLNIEKSYLEAAGYQVFTAQNGKEALEKLEQTPIDVVVTDLDMPVCNGYDFTRAIRAREQWKAMPVMALTALSGEKDREKGMEAGIDEYQIKLNRNEVLRALELLILRKRG
ncbi:two-component system sensory/regulatory protein, Che family [Candidatus Vecturithrix granuli]|uniref:histidine kinase n=1 Tax=Vecturithrix granuli TaxID=1499967 RepID=A0A081C3E4_VECG1|nr:two-component system sensory/regulatory protein, Che family [Candidatus Vecturithrix granuli]